jgi:hypothetical protein
MLLFRFQLVEQGIEALKVSFPDLPVSRNPGLQFLERRGPQRINSALRIYANVHQTRVTEHPQVLRDLRLLESELIDHVPDRPGPLKQEFDDLKTMGFSEGAECFDHGKANMPQYVYTCQGIFASMGSRRWYLIPGLRTHVFTRLLECLRTLRLST